MGQILEIDWKRAFYLSPANVHLNLIEIEFQGGLASPFRHLAKPRSREDRFALNQCTRQIKIPSCKIVRRAAFFQ